MSKQLYEQSSAPSGTGQGPFSKATLEALERDKNWIEKRFIAATLKPCDPRCHCSNCRPDLHKLEY